MVTAGEFWHHTAVRTVQIYLTVQFFSDQTTLGVVDCHTGFVARSFDSEDVHLEIRSWTHASFAT